MARTPGRPNASKAQLVLFVSQACPLVSGGWLCCKHCSESYCKDSEHLFSHPPRSSSAAHTILRVRWEGKLGMRSYRGSR